MHIKKLSKSVWFRRILPLPLILGLIILVLSFINSPSPVNAQTSAWVRATPARSCSEVCSNGEREAISSGKNVDGFSFFVCSGKAPNGEWRPGFNIESRGASGLCLFEYGGGGIQASKYACLCN